MKKQNKTSSTPLNWWFGGPENHIIGYYSGTSPVAVGQVFTLNEVTYPVLDFKIDWTYSSNTGVVWPDFKKTLNVTKKEDIKFV